MKLKRMLAIVMAAGLSIFSLAGCNVTTNNYVNELTKTTTWGATSNQVSGNINILQDGVNTNITFTGTGYNNGNKGMSEITFNDPSGNVNIPKIKCYVDNNTTYINKSYFTELYALEGETVPSGLANINAEYIGIDSGMNIAEVQQIVNNPQKIMQFTSTLFNNEDVDLPLKQNGRQYSVNMTSDEMIDYAMKLIKAGSNNLENINSTLGLNLTAEKIAAIKSGVNNSDETVAMVKTILAGSSVSGKQTFTDNSSSTSFNINLKIQNSASMAVSISSTSTKAEVKDIVMPTSTVKLTEAQFQQLL